MPKRATLYLRQRNYLGDNDHIQFSHLSLGILENSLMLFEIIIRSKPKA